MEINKAYRKNKEYIACLIDDLGGKNVTYTEKDQIWFFWKGKRCNYWVKSEWLSGSSVKDGRGVKHLVRQLSKKQNNNKQSYLQYIGYHDKNHQPKHLNAKHNQEQLQKPNLR